MMTLAQNRHRTGTPDQNCEKHVRCVAPYVLAPGNEEHPHKLTRFHSLVC